MRTAGEVILMETSCSELRTSERLLENIAWVLLTFSENEINLLRRLRVFREWH
jgi:hypothetical protein